MEAVRPAVRKLAAAMTRRPVGVPVTFATGLVAYSLPSGHVSVQVGGMFFFFADYYGPRPANGDTVGVLFVDGSPIILGVAHGLPPLTP